MTPQKKRSLCSQLAAAGIDYEAGASTVTINGRDYGRALALTNIGTQLTEPLGATLLRIL